MEKRRFYVQSLQWCLHGHLCFISIIRGERTYFSFNDNNNLPQTNRGKVDNLKTTLFYLLLHIVHWHCPKYNISSGPLPVKFNKQWNETFYFGISVNFRWYKAKRKTIHLFLPEFLGASKSAYMVCMVLIYQQLYLNHSII